MSPQHFAAGAAVLVVVVGVVFVRRGQRKGRVTNDQVRRRHLEVVVRPEAEVVVLFLRRRVDPATLVPRERPLFVVARDDVLPQRPAEGLEPISKSADQRKVPLDRMGALGAVDKGDHAQEESHPEKGHRRESHGWPR
jgi:hypothetical protein